MRTHVVLQNPGQSNTGSFVHRPHCHALPPVITSSVQWTAYSQACPLTHAFLCAFTLVTPCYSVLLLLLLPSSPPSHLPAASSRHLPVCTRFSAHWLHPRTRCCCQVTSILLLLLLLLLLPPPPPPHSIISTGDERDALFDGHQLHTLQLQYDLKLSAKATVTLAVPSLHGVLCASIPWNYCRF